MQQGSRRISIHAEGKSPGQDSSGMEESIGSVAADNSPHRAAVRLADHMIARLSTNFIKVFCLDEWTSGKRTVCTRTEKTLGPDSGLRAVIIPFHFPRFHLVSAIHAVVVGLSRASADFRYSKVHLLCPVSLGQANPH